MKHFPKRWNKSTNITNINKSFHLSSLKTFALKEKTFQTPHAVYAPPRPAPWPPAPALLSRGWPSHRAGLRPSPRPATSPGASWELQIDSQVKGTNKFFPKSLFLFFWLKVFFFPKVVFFSEVFFSKVRKKSRNTMQKDMEKRKIGSKPPISECVCHFSLTISTKGKKGTQIWKFQTYTGPQWMFNGSFRSDLFSFTFNEEIILMNHGEIYSAL